MKNFLFVLLLLPLTLWSQVGINTTIPTKTLDVNGQVRVRDLPLGDITDYLVVTTANGELRKIPISTLITVNNTCPILMRNDSNPYYLKFTSTSSIPNPNNSVIVNGVSWAFAGTFNSNNLFHYSYTNTSGVALNLNQPFVVTFSTSNCTYTP